MMSDCSQTTDTKTVENNASKSVATTEDNPSEVSSLPSESPSAKDGPSEVSSLPSESSPAKDSPSEVSSAPSESSPAKQTTSDVSASCSEDTSKAASKTVSSSSETPASECTSSDESTAKIAAAIATGKVRKEVLVTVDPTTGERSVVPEEMRRIETLKNAGNDHFSNKQFIQSLQLYSEAIGLLREALGMKDGDSFDQEMGKTLSKPTKRLSSVLLSNRANSYIHLEMPLQSLDDAEQAVDVDPSYPKAYFRRGTALLSLNRGEEAMNDFHKAAFLCPKDPIALQKVRECENFVKMQAHERSVELADQLARRKAVEKLSQLVDVAGTELGPPDPARYHDSVLSDVPTLQEFDQMIDGFKRGKRIHGHYIAKMLFKVFDILKKLPNVVTVDLAPGERITVVGDIHGQFYDLLHIFEMNGLPSEKNSYLFNGDFVDRGAWGVECILTLLTLKCMYPNHVHLARGNHETVTMNRTYGFSQEACEKYGNLIEMLLCEVFCALPLAHVLGGKVFVVHGGLSAKTPRDVAGIDTIQQIDRFCQPPENSVMSDLLWSDPQEPRGIGISPRGIGCLFGPDVTTSFLERNKLELVIRSHESVMTGYSLHQQGKLVTVFSAPNYCDTLGNEAAIVVFNDPEMKPVFMTFQASPHPSVSQKFDLLSLFRF